MQKCSLFLYYIPALIIQLFTIYSLSSPKEKSAIYYGSALRGAIPKQNTKFGANCVCFYHFRSRFNYLTFARMDNQKKYYLTGLRIAKVFNIAMFRQPLPRANEYICLFIRNIGVILRVNGCILIKPIQWEQQFVFMSSQSHPKDSLAFNMHNRWKQNQRYNKKVYLDVLYHMSYYHEINIYTTKLYK